MTSDGGRGPPEEGPRDGPGDEPDLVGTVLADRYRIVRRLGVGAMGQVYLGEHIRIGRRDAIKVLRASLARDTEAIARFTRGARNVSRIRHRNVCTLYDFGYTEDGLHFVAMEYVEGDTLSRILEQDGPLPPERAVGIAVQVAEALQAAHDLGIVHRDLKPDNIMISREAGSADQVKVVDFDIARGPADEEGPAVTRHGFVVGTPEYMSPEQLTGDPLDGRSDVYSLAFVLFRMLTGRLPFAGDTAQEVMIQRLTVSPASLSATAPGLASHGALERAIESALERKAETRPTARALAEQLKGALSGAEATSGASPESTSEASIPATQVSARSREERTRPAASGMAVLAGGGALLLAVGALGAVWLFGGSTEGPTEPDAGPPVGLEIEPLVESLATEGVAQEAGESEEAAPPTATPAPPRAQAAEEPAPASVPERTPAEVVAIAPADVRDVLFRQFLLQDEVGTRVALEAARDTARAVLHVQGLSRADSAAAYNILGLVHASLGDTVQAIRDLERAVRLDPRDQYVNMLNLFRGLRR